VKHTFCYHAVYAQRGSRRLRPDARTLLSPRFPLLVNWRPRERSVPCQSLVARVCCPRARPGRSPGPRRMTPPFHAQWRGLRRPLAPSGQSAVPVNDAFWVTGLPVSKAYRAIAGRPSVHACVALGHGLCGRRRSGLLDLAGVMRPKGRLPAATCTFWATGLPVSDGYNCHRRVSPPRGPVDGYRSRAAGWPTSPLR
jgi:hypothetical protein